MITGWLALTLLGAMALAAGWVLGSGLFDLVGWMLRNPTK